MNKFTVGDYFIINNKYTKWIGEIIEIENERYKVRTIHSFYPKIIDTFHINSHYGYIAQKIKHSDIKSINLLYE